MTNTTTTSTVPRAHHSNAPQGTERSHTVIIFVAERPGSVDRVVGVLRRRRSNLQSFSLGPSKQEGIIRITAQVKDAEVVIDHLVEQLRKIIDVRHVEQLNERESLVRELALIQVNVQSTNRQAAIAAGEQAGASVAHETAETITFEVVGSTEKVAQVMEALQPYGIQELARSGCVAVAQATGDK